MLELQIIFEGRVQGVGFRGGVKQLSKGFEVCGWVKNLPDGRVEMQVRGEEVEVEAFVKEIEESQLRVHFQKMERHSSQGLEGWKSFRIIS